MLALPTDDALEIFLRSAVTPLEVAFEEGEVVVTATDLSLIGDGPDLPSALESLDEEIEAFALEYFDRFEYYRHTPDQVQAPFLLRFLLTPAARRRELLLEPLRRGEMGTSSGLRVPPEVDSPAA